MKLVILLSGFSFEEFFKSFPLHNQNLWVFIYFIIALDCGCYYGCVNFYAVNFGHMR